MERNVTREMRKRAKIRQEKENRLTEHRNERSIFAVVCQKKSVINQMTTSFVVKWTRLYRSVGFFSASSQAIAGVFAMHAKRTSNETMNDSRLGGH